MNNDIINFLDWDSKFFNKRIAKILTNCLSHNDTKLIDLWTKKNQIECVYYLANGIDINSTYEAEINGFHFIDLRVTYRINLNRRTSIITNTDPIRNATYEDMLIIKKMARKNHYNSRFFIDPNFNTEKSEELFEVWIEKDFQSENHYLWVWVEDNIPIAYTSASVNILNGTAVIGLVGVNPNWLNRGIASKLQFWVLNKLHFLGLNIVEVITQGRNIGAQNLYQKCGYKLQSISLWYHKWY